MQTVGCYCQINHITKKVSEENKNSMQKFTYKYMRKSKVSTLFPLLILIVCMNCCNPNSLPIKGKYADSHSEITLNKSADSIWLKVTNLFVAKGLMVKSIDKVKGQIVTTKTPFISAYTFEDKDGQLEEPQAWVVLSKVFLKKKQWIPKKIYSQWSIQISEIAEGRTLVKVDPVVICTYYPNGITSVEDRGQSTGTLEALIKQF
jgi:hypothetical protein